jgi:hypothetical protein
VATNCEECFGFLPLFWVVHPTYDNDTFMCNVKSKTDKWKRVKSFNISFCFIILFLLWCWGSTSILWEQRILA